MPPDAMPSTTLDVLAMTRPHLDNYNHHATHLLQFLERYQCHLAYEGPSDVQQHIIQKSSYCLSIVRRGTKNTPTKSLPTQFPVMIGSDVDLAIRFQNQRVFRKAEGGIPPTPTPRPPFAQPDLAIGGFIINGGAKLLPYQYTNDPNTPHVTKDRIVRSYTYDALDRGRQLSYYTDGSRPPDQQLLVTHNDGQVTPFESDGFFDHCPYPTDMVPYLSRVFKENSFDIDHLGNKTVFSPGHLFFRLIVKYLHKALKNNNWHELKQKAKLVTQWIVSGHLLHVLSRKTPYQKEQGGSGGGGRYSTVATSANESAGKMVSIPNMNPREIGANGEVFMEKSTGCYRDFLSQIYMLTIYMLFMIVRQISSKAKETDAAHKSQEGFFGFSGWFETKTIGRTGTLARYVIVSVTSDLDPVIGDPRHSRLYKLLQLEPASRDDSRPAYVVVNEACIPVTRACFRRIDLLALKRALRVIECYAAGTDFIHVRYKAGILFKPLPSSESVLEAHERGEPILDQCIWVSPRDADFWWHQCLPSVRTREDLQDRLGFAYLTAYTMDLVPYFRHDTFPKVTWTLNSLKTSVLAIGSTAARYFLDPLTAYRERSPQDEAVLPPADAFSEHFVMYVPRVTVAYHSHRGFNQEDCIVVRKGLRVYDCKRFFTIRCHIECLAPTTAKKTDGFAFYPSRGHHQEGEDGFLGTVVACRPGHTVHVDPQSIHVRVEYVNDYTAQLFFVKRPFRLVQYHDTEPNRLIVCVEQDHRSDTGDKLCSFHGQKGVIHVLDDDTLPLLDESVRPDLIVNPYSLNRTTIGQILEGIERGGGRDARTVRNFARKEDGTLESWMVPKGSTFYAGTLYLPLAYFSSEHIYAPYTCVQDKITGQAVKGRSRGGGMRIGNMELMNGMRGNGIAAAFEEKFFEHGDRGNGDGSRNGPNDDLPKSVELVREEFKFYKCQLHYTSEAYVQED